jgi:hypothetical protein
MTPGLPDGFFDQPNPGLTPETIARLKSSLDHIHFSADIDHAYEEVDNAVVVNQSAHTSADDGLLEQAEMPKKRSSGAAPAIAKKSTAAAVKREAPRNGTVPPKHLKVSQKPASQRSLELNQVALSATVVATLALRRIDFPFLLNFSTAS